MSAFVARPLTPTLSVSGKEVLGTVSRRERHCALARRGCFAEFVPGSSPGQALGLTHSRTRGLAMTLPITVIARNAATKQSRSS